jgi:7-cyano-7-deazaguanine synthase
MDDLVLFSGGMDSAVSLMCALDRQRYMERVPGRVHAITFDYGQRHRSEVDAAAHIWNFLQTTPYLHILGKKLTVSLAGMPSVGSLMGCAPVNVWSPEQISSAKFDVSKVDSSFIPHRNLLFITIAAQWATLLKAHRIVTGLRGGFPDCSERFEAQITDILKTSNPDWPLTVMSYVHQSRVQAVRMMKSIDWGMKVLGLTMTCFHGTEPPCGKCLPCIKRAEGFAMAGVPDPLLVRLKKEPKP